jgi:hypothetical protein
VNRTLELSDINVKLSDVRSSIKSLCDEDVDIHSGIVAPLQSEYYCNHIGTSVYLKKSFFKDLTFVLFVNKNSTITESDLNKKKIVVYIVSDQSATVTKLRRFIRDANMNEKNFDFRVVSERDIYESVRCNNNVAGLAWAESPLYKH